jgi:outer membrane lipase/esterase
MKLNVYGGIARAALWTAALACAALLASCGGSSTPQTYFATRVIAFGDEFSVITPSQQKYSINALAAGSSSAVDCAANPLWIQSVASLYGLVFPQCAGGVSEPSSRIVAFNGAVVGDLSGQIDAQIAESGIGNGDMSTVLVGANDVYQQFLQYPGVGEDVLTANLTQAGNELATQVNRLAGLGTRVIVSTIPDMGLMPFAGDRTAGSVDSNPALLTRLSKAFNDAFLANLMNDGRQIGLVQLDETLGAIDTQTQLGQGSFTNVMQVACAVALPNCTNNTLVTDAVTGNFLWADSRHLSSTGQAILGSLGVQRAQNNPF